MAAVALKVLAQLIRAAGTGGDHRASLKPPETVAFMDAISHAEP
jgi:hypothetical protein